MKKVLVLIRHGESLGNLENRFTGWLDVDLTKKGYLESYRAGVKLRKLKNKFEICYTSILKRAIRTTWGVLDGLSQMHTKIVKSINLNERHYGKLSGLNKIESTKRFGRNNINKWLNEYEDCPPPIDKDDKCWFKKKKYENIKNLPLTESLNDMLKRILKIWNKIKKNINKKNIIIVSHSNLLRVLTKKIIEKNTIKDSDNIILNSIPIVYEFNENLEVLKKTVLN